MGSKNTARNLYDELDLSSVDIPTTTAGWDHLRRTNPEAWHRAIAAHDRLQKNQPLTPLCESREQTEIKAREAEATQRAAQQAAKPNAQPIAMTDEEKAQANTVVEKLNDAVKKDDDESILKIYESGDYVAAMVNQLFAQKTYATDISGRKALINALAHSENEKLLLQVHRIRRERIAGRVAALEKTKNTEIDSLKERVATLEFRIGALMSVVGESMTPGKTFDGAMRYEERIRALEDRPSLKYRGVWSASTQYATGDVVTDGGSMHYANINSKAVRPGDGNCWTLCVKHGRDSR